MKTLFFIVLIVIALVWIGRRLRQRELEKFRETDVGLLNEIRQEVVPRHEAEYETPPGLSPVPKEQSQLQGEALSSDVLSEDLSEDLSAESEGRSVVQLRNPSSINPSINQPLDIRADILAELEGAELKPMLFTERQRRYLEILEDALADRYRVFVNLSLSDFMRTTLSRRVSFVICDAQYLAVEALVEFRDALDEPSEMMIRKVGKPLLLLRGNEKSDAVVTSLAELMSGLVRRNHSPSCPKCEGDMEIREPASGKHAGKQIWVCRAYPQCRGAQPA